MDIVRVVGYLRPGSNPLWQHSNATTLAEMVEWRDQYGRLPPDQAECDAAWLDLQGEDAYKAIVDSIQQAAEGDVASIPGWASWDEATALAWLTANVSGTVPANVYTWMQAITRLTIALRNDRWPNLEAGG